MSCELDLAYMDNVMVLSLKTIATSDSSMYLVIFLIIIQIAIVRFITFGRSLLAKSIQY